MAASPAEGQGLSLRGWGKGSVRWGGELREPPSSPAHPAKSRRGGKASTRSTPSSALQAQLYPAGRGPWPHCPNSGEGHHSAGLRGHRLAPSRAGPRPLTATQPRAALGVWISGHGRPWAPYLGARGCCGPRPCRRGALPRPQPRAAAAARVSAGHGGRRGERRRPGRSAC